MNEINQPITETQFRMNTMIAARRRLKNDNIGAHSSYQTSAATKKHWVASTGAAATLK